MKTGEWTLRSRRVVTPSGPRAADVVIRDESIAQLAEYDGPEAEGVILDAGDLAVMPGLVALHLDGLGHPGPRGFEAATGDSAAEGMTTLVDLPPDHEPEAGAPSTFHARMAAVQGRIRVDCGLIIGLGRADARRIESWIEAGVIGVEAFLDATEADLRAVMPMLASLGRTLLVHQGRAGRSSTSYVPSHPFGSALPEREYEALRLVIRLCRESRCPVHLIHPTAAEALPMIAEARGEGLPLTVETCPHHLSFAAEEIEDGVPTFTLDPDRRGAAFRERLWEGLASGLIDGVGSDHSRAFSPSAASAPGELRLARCELAAPRLALPAIWTEARRRGFALDDLARWTASGAARAFGLSGRKGSIVPGLDADFVVFDPDADHLAEPGSDLRSDPSPPLDGRTLRGRVEATILRGNLIYQGGQFFENPKGAVVLRLEETQPIQGPKAR